MRSTCGPSQSSRAPRATSRACSSAENPPSGPASRHSGRDSLHLRAACAAALEALAAVGAEFPRRVAAARREQRVEARHAELSEPADEFLGVRGLGDARRDLDPGELRARLAWPRLARQLAQRAQLEAALLELHDLELPGPAASVEALEAVAHLEPQDAPRVLLVLGPQHGLPPCRGRRLEEESSQALAHTGILPPRAWIPQPTRQTGDAGATASR